jgi:hypothetical protein
LWARKSTTSGEIKIGFRKTVHIHINELRIFGFKWLNSLAKRKIITNGIGKLITTGIGKTCFNFNFSCSRPTTGKILAADKDAHW